MRVLVTGGAGFIASHVAEAYLASGHEVLVLDDLSTGRRENLPPSVRLEVGDITDAPLVERLTASFRPDLVSHHAAQINVRRSVEDPADDARVNVIGSLVVLEAARRHGVGKVVFASSGGAIYGEQETFPAAEDHVQAPLSPYGVAKLAVEKYLHYYREVWGMRSVALRYANVYGPRQDPHGEAGVVAIFFTRMFAGQQPVINGDGLQTRDYVFVGDVAAANLAASAEGVEGVFNIGTGIETTVNDIFAMAKRLTGTTFDEVHAEAKKGEQRRSSVGAGLLSRTTGWRPRVGLEEGFALTCEHFRRRGTKA